MSQTEKRHMSALWGAPWNLLLLECVKKHDRVDGNSLPSFEITARFILVWYPNSRESSSNNKVHASITTVMENQIGKR